MTITRKILLGLILLLLSLAIVYKQFYYFAGSEPLAEDEIRLTACGTGMPAPNPFQAGTCWLIETTDAGNFIFDLGTHSMGRIATLAITPDKLDKVFLTHLHSDHWGDLPSLWIGGWVMGRSVPLHVYGPSGDGPGLGTDHAIEHFLEAYRWDRTSRAGVLNSLPGTIIAHEFDHKIEGNVIYEQNGAIVSSFPAVHAIDGPVAYRFEYKGLSVVLTGDNFPNKFTLRNSQNADLVVHESFLDAEFMVDSFGLHPKVALEVATEIHTSPQAFGMLMNQLKPRRAVAFHFLNLPITTGAIEDGIREHYQGELDLADDMMMWNISKDDIRVRKILWNPFNPPKAGQPLPPNKDMAIPMSERLIDSKLDVTEVEAKMKELFYQKYFSEHEPEKDEH
jgi:ribonuclease Z